MPNGGPPEICLTLVELAKETEQEIKSLEKTVDLQEKRIARLERENKNLRKVITIKKKEQWENPRKIIFAALKMP